MKLMWLLLLLTACNEPFRFDEDGGTALPAPAMRPGPCASDADCGLPALHCEAASGACVECTADSQCEGGARGRCDPDRLRCVECVDSADCPNAGVCEPNARRCRAACATLADCPAGTLECDLDHGSMVCEQCETRADCASTPATPICERHTERCVECVFDTDCPGARPHCDWVSARCEQCADSSDCPAQRPLCDPQSHLCGSS